ncbi:hypothetical protein KKG29_04705 [Patescibacteria group bacterium]|nr:hypothetical protein [Patescibacteria group bacterium]MBU4000438.1 hypothetical protein [Patescibacteria group bacterium]MBU4057203.1 hypothetical protein [Patescibacteria group bacterium]MBU4368225.1 hypothetical protein [Patescibacteria group bacterium]
MEDAINPVRNAISNGVKEKIIAALKNIVKYIDADADVSLKEIGPDFYAFNIKTKESSLLIGRDGANIGSLDRLARVVLRKEVFSGFSFIIDINNYRQEKIEHLKQAAQKTALVVSWRNRPETLRPMGAFERKIIHMEIANSPLVETKSVGEEPYRSVVISPRKQETPLETRSNGKTASKNIDIDKIINS